MELRTQNLLINHKIHERQNILRKLGRDPAEDQILSNLRKKKLMSFVPNIALPRNEAISRATAELTELRKSPRVNAEIIKRKEAFLRAINLIPKGVQRATNMTAPRIVSKK